MEEQTTTEPVAQEETQASEETQPEQQQSEAVTQTASEPGSDDSGDTASETAEEDDSDLEEWASNKGISVETENEKKLAKMYRDAEKNMHQTTEKASELEKTLTEEAQGSQSEDTVQQLQTQVQYMQLQNSIRDFKEQHDVDPETETAMAKELKEKPYLWNDLEAAYGKAKLKTDQNQSEDLKKEGGQEALQQLAQKQKTAAPKGNAVDSKVSKDGITRDKIAQKTAEGDLQWLQSNKSEIDRLVASGEL